MTWQVWFVHKERIILSSSVTLYQTQLHWTGECMCEMTYAIANCVIYLLIVWCLAWYDVTNNGCMHRHMKTKYQHLNGLICHNESCYVTKCGRFNGNDVGDYSDNGIVGLDRVELIVFHCPRKMALIDSKHDCNS